MDDSSVEEIPIECELLVASLFDLFLCDEHYENEQKSEQMHLDHFKHFVDMVFDVQSHDMKV